MYLIDYDVYKYRIIAEQVFQRENNMFFYQFNIKNYEFMLSKYNKNSAEFNDIEKRMQEEAKQLQNEEMIYAALLSQINNKDLFLNEIEKLRVKNADTN